MSIHTVLHRACRAGVPVIAVALFPLHAAQAQRAPAGGIRGTILNAATHAPLAGAVVSVAPGARRTVADDRGTFAVTALTAGTYSIRVQAIGFEPARVTVTVADGEMTHASISLTPAPTRLAAIEVRAGVLSPDLAPATALRQQQVREANPQDLGNVMRALPGVDAVRRGPLGFDPSVRGLRETEVGTYIDGARMFPAGPARMDSPVSHLDPSTIRSIDVVKGPYALTWGAGDLTAIRVRTQDLPPAQSGVMHGNFTSGYTRNGNAADGVGSLTGSSGNFSYLATGAWRRGYQYTSGDGTSIPGDFTSSEGRGKLGYRLPDGSSMTVSGGYQGQGPIDYPGNLLNAKFFHTFNGTAEWKRERSSGTVRSIDAEVYTNHVSHRMTNDGKPTAEPNPNRVPPFPLDILVNAGVKVNGGRFALGLASSGPWQFEVGGDVYSANRDATRYIYRRDTRMLMFTSLMWPDATITDGGVFARAMRSFGGEFSFSATGRMDLVHAHADTASDFFEQHTSGNLTSNETNWSGAATLRDQLDPHWSTTIGIGSAVRTADATERYSDRTPASKAQTSAEFMGNPDLAPERNTQADLWIEASFPRWSLQLNPFVRWMQNYITIEPTNLPKLLPLSPPTVYQYTNGTGRYWGVEASMGYAFTPALTGRGGLNYLYGRNETLVEPALGVAPLEALLGLRFEPPQGRGYVEGELHLVGEQDRVATQLGETSTEGHTTVDLRAGLALMPSVELRFGVLNAANAQYVDHLNAKNPYTGMPIAEPGRQFFANLTYAF